MYPSYHYCITLENGRPRVVETHDLRANMRDVREDPSAPYAAHTAGRNSYAAGLSIMGMQDARPEDFGLYPLTEAAIDALCRVAAEIANHFAIEVNPERIMTHAEAAIADGYFGSAEEERWDIARLAPSPRPLTPRDAHETGDELRRRVTQSLSKDVRQ